MIFGSFSTNKAAQQWAEIVSNKLSIAAQIDVTTNANRIYNRVTSELMNEKDARALIRQARSAGYSDVWYLVSKDTFVLTQIEKGPEVRREEPEEANPRKSELKRMPEDPAVRPQNSYSLARLQRTTAAVTENERDSQAPLVKEVKAFSPRFDAVTIPQSDKSTISIDGRVDEPIWETIPAFSELRVVQPDTLAKPDFAIVLHRKRNLRRGRDGTTPRDRGGAIVHTRQKHESRRIRLFDRHIGRRKIWVFL